MANNKQKMLGLNDLGTVLTEIHSVCAKWYNIGLRLSVPVADLQRIESEYKNDHGTCLRHMLIKWLEMGCATWKALIDALQSPIVQGGENTALAETLRRRYCGEVGEEEGKKGKTFPTTSAGSNSSGGTSAAPNTSEKISTNSNPTRDGQSTDGTSKSREKSSAVAAKAGEAPGASKAKKRLPTSDSPGPSAAKKSKLASTNLKLPDSFANDDFLRGPEVDRLCVKCKHVPYNPQRSVCCNRLYCRPCSKKSKRCRTHKADLQYISDKELYSKIQKLKIKCPNRGGGCDWTGIVLNLKNHLPDCVTGGHTQGKGAGVQKIKQGEKASKTHSKATESGRGVAMASQIHITAADSGSSNGTSLSTATGEGQNTETTGAAKPIGGEANKNRITVEDVEGMSASTASCLPLNMVMKRVSDYQTSRGKIWFSPTFLSHQLGYKLRLAVKVQPQTSLPFNENLQLGVAVVSSPGDQEDFLKLPCIGDATLQILNPEENEHHIDISVGFMIGDEPERFTPTYAPVPQAYIHHDCLFFSVVEVDLDEEYKPWLLNPQPLETDDSSSVDSNDSISVDSETSDD